MRTNIACLLFAANISPVDDEVELLTLLHAIFLQPVDEELSGSGVNVLSTSNK